MNSLFDLSGRVALVAGGGGQIGRAVSLGLAAHGATVVVSDLQSAAATKVVEELQAKHSGAHRGMVADVSRPEGVETLVAGCGPRLDIVVHCVGLISSVPMPGYAVPFDQQTLEAWNKALAANLTSAFLLARGVHPLLKQSGRGSLILFSSIYASLGPNPSLYEQTAMNNPVAYGASKGGLEQVMRYLAAEWAPDVRVNCVAPGGIERGQDPRFVERYRRLTPMQRMATPDDVVGSVVFLAGDAAGYVTGHSLRVDGGWSCW